MAISTPLFQVPTGVTEGLSCLVYFRHDDGSSILSPFATIFLVPIPFATAKHSSPPDTDNLLRHYLSRKSRSFSDDATRFDRFDLSDMAAGHLVLRESNTTMYFSALVLPPIIEDHPQGQRGGGRGVGLGKTWLKGWPADSSSGLPGNRY